MDWMGSFSGYNSSNVSVEQDIKNKRKEGKLFNVLISFGGEHNKFNLVGVTDYRQLA